MHSALITTTKYFYVQLLIDNSTVELYYKYYYVFCRHKTFWKIGVCYALSNGVCDEWLSLIEPIMNDAIKVSVLCFMC